VPYWDSKFLIARLSDIIRRSPHAHCQKVEYRACWYGYSSSAELRLSDSPAVSHSAEVMRRGGPVDRNFYLGMSLLLVVVVIYGFSQTINENLIHAVPSRPWILWVHGMLFSSWLMFFILQSALVRTHNVAIHRTLGWLGAGMGVLIAVVGTSTAIVMDRFHFLLSGDPDSKVFFAVQLLDIVSFTTVFWLAFYWRKKPEFHRRLMLIATCVLTSAAFARFPKADPAISYFGVDALILLGLLHDLRVSRTVHVVYGYALPVLIVWQTLMVQTWLRHPDWWVKVTNAIID
jgi:hypothetical protein